jgi:hydroxymethylpyrimidine kinase/phosphomethylpyrimidine kinase
MVSAANARALSRFLDDKKKSAAGYPPPVVWDPVFAASGGGILADDAAIAAMKKYLLPRAYLITPNRAEALRLAGIAADAGDDDAVIQAARRLRKSGARNVLVTGADGGGKARIRHLLFGEKRDREWRCRRLDGVYHGSGCAFAAAIAANLAHRRPLIKAIGRAQIYTDKALRHSYAYAALGAQKIPRR